MSLDVDFIHLRNAATSLLVDVRTDRQPAVLHWGPDLGQLSDLAAAELALATEPAVGQSSFDTPIRTGLLPEAAAGHLGRPGLSGHRHGRAWSPLFRLTDVTVGQRDAALTSVDDVAGLILTTEIILSPSGILRLRHSLRNVGHDDYTLDGLEVSLPLAARSTEVLDFTGRWASERQPQRQRIRAGTWVRESHEGRSGHDFPGTVVGLAPQTTFATGEAWAVTLAWSGDHRHFVERLADGTSRIGAGELLLPGEVILAPGETYESPWLACAYSDQGLDGISAAFHSWLRSRPRHPTNVRPRPLTLNVWEAVYFDHDLDRLKALADVAAEIGVERFVLDDGWFHRRDQDTRGLGDWWIDEQRWPDGLAPLIDYVRAKHMEFGLWFEPEMINPDSDTFRAHPDWILAEAGRISPNWRHQQVLDLANPEAFDHVLTHMDALIGKYDIPYVKWDHNRVLVDAGHAGRPGVHAQTQATYRLIDELKQRHPSLEIESCASGGGRVDLGMLERTDRVWASDCNDALERQSIQFWTQVVLPPELIGSHVGPTHGHTTGRTHDLSFRAITALFGHAGIEWDITTASPEERAALASWISYYKQHRGLLHSGRVVRGDHPDEAIRLHGVVAQDRTEALYSYAQLRTSGPSRPILLTLPGLDPHKQYSLRLEFPAGRPWAPAAAWPAWTQDRVVLSGAVLTRVGIRPPQIGPEQAVVFRAEVV